MTLKEAKELAIKKWEWIVEHEGFFDDESICVDIPEISNFRNLCSYCELFIEKKCEGCPLYIGFSCMGYNHPYNKWVFNSTEENAQKVLDLIKSIEV